MRRCTFKQADVQRALRAAKAEGIDDPVIEIEPSGKIRIAASKKVDAADTALPNALDAWRAGRAHR